MSEVNQSDPWARAPACDFAEVLRAERAAIGAPEEELAALCLSGGGIRSATFGLGVLQGLARFGLLGRFHYLSTVSGGGYIGSWLSAWRSVESDATIFEALNASQQTGCEPPQITGLRADSNYITPTLGLLSADTWTVVALYVRNLILNWILFGPFFVGCFLFPHWCAVTLHWARSQHGFESRSWIYVGCAFLTVALSSSICGRFRMRGQWLSTARFLYLVLAPVVLSAMCFTLAAAVAKAADWIGTDGGFTLDQALLGAEFGAAVYFSAWCIGRLAARRWDLRIMVGDLTCWVGAGAVVGAMIACGIHIIAAHPHDIRAVVILGLSGVVLAYLAGDILYVGASSLSHRGDMDREWLARASGWLSAVAVTWALISSIVLYGPALLRSASAAAQAAIAGIGGVSGIVTLALGASAETAATRAGEVLKHVSVARLVSAAAIVFAVLLVAILSFVGQHLVAVLKFATGLYPFWGELILIPALIGSAFIVSLFVNVNRFSMHALYRNRLVRAFLGSARGAVRFPDPFTGFDPQDNLKLAQALPLAPKSALFHVVNAALNVVSSKKRAWQERKAESFAMTRLHCGNPFVRYQPTAAYADKRGGISLGTAMAISGAAVSPNQGYNSSPLIGFLLMLFNVRLGWWLANPKRELSALGGPTWGIVPALKELAGATTDEGRWVYLSDGGHFENLGLYEMIRRRCRYIVVSDAGCDPKCTFEDLGNAVRKIYIDFGVSIDFKTLDIRARDACSGSGPASAATAGGVRFAIGTISYPGEKKPGWLLYIKPTYHGTDEGVDVRSYASGHPEFPHESTTDQWFSESQLEAYRALGAHILEGICSGGAGVQPGHKPPEMTIELLKATAEKYLWGAAARPAG